MIEILRFTFYSSCNPDNPHFEDNLDTQFQKALNELSHEAAQFIDIASSTPWEAVGTDGWQCTKQSHRVIVNARPAHPYRDRDTRTG
jgi:hypothetical protein